MEKKKRFSFLKLLIVIICLVAIIVSAGANILFAGNKVPSLFGRHIYLVGEDNPMTGEITTGAALLAKDAEGITISRGDIVLCYPASDPTNLTLRSIREIGEAANGNGAFSYYTNYSGVEEKDPISKSSIVAVCTGYQESLELGRFIEFTRSFAGIIVLLAVPALILIIFIVSAISRSRRSDDDDQYDFYEYEEDEDEEEEQQGKKKKDNKSARSGDPLYEPDSDTAPKPELERKKMSIAENFSQKQVNPNSPYQREKEKERTMQFKAPKSGSASTSSAESSFAARNPGAQTSAVPTADALREEMLRKTAEAERSSTGSFTSNTGSFKRISDNTGVLSKSQVAELSKGSSSFDRSQTPKPAPKKSDSPDISDILKKSRSTSTKKDPSDMSVDDLLKMIEDQKSKF